MFLRIPYLQLFTMVRRYCLLTGRSFRILTRYDQVNGPQDMDWDDESELSYGPWTRKRGVILVAFVVIMSTLLTVTVTDSRGSEGPEL